MHAGAQVKAQSRVEGTNNVREYVHARLSSRHTNFNFKKSEVLPGNMLQDSCKVNKACRMDETVIDHDDQSLSVHIWLLLDRKTGHRIMPPNN